ncbi:hypothetical protein ACCO45_003700 [Purpureocillium lilacinum]|uniref:Uncharacterized protein n=1 Tax=Purpureocillium lilacinum TaxID=33203 RepID=A0ACC4E1X2_PURLI
MKRRSRRISPVSINVGAVERVPGSGVDSSALDGTFPSLLPSPAAVRRHRASLSLLSTSATGFGRRRLPLASANLPNGNGTAPPHRFDHHRRGGAPQKKSTHPQPTIEVAALPTATEDRLPCQSSELPKLPKLLLQHCPRQPRNRPAGESVPAELAWARWPPLVAANCRRHHGATSSCP